MKPSIVPLITLFLVGNLSATVVVLTEGFENPVYTDPAFVVFTTGSQTFDNGNEYQINTPGNNTGNAPTLGISSADTSGTYPTTQGATSQVFGFGAGNNSGANSLAITLNGFTGATSGTIEFDHFATGTGVQTLDLLIVDTDNPATQLFSGNFSGTTLAALSTFSAPSGDSITVTFTQAGSTTSADFFIDNITISAVPEPSSILLVAFGSIALLRRRSRA